MLFEKRGLEREAPETTFEEAKTHFEVNAFLHFRLYSGVRTLERTESVGQNEMLLFVDIIKRFVIEKERDFSVVQEPMG